MGALIIKFDIDWGTLNINCPETLMSPNHQEYINIYSWCFGEINVLGQSIFKVPQWMTNLIIKAPESDLVYILGLSEKPCYNCVTFDNNTLTSAWRFFFHSYVDDNVNLSTAYPCIQLQTCVWWCHKTNHYHVITWFLAATQAPAATSHIKYQTGVQWRHHIWKHLVKII